MTKRWSRWLVPGIFALTLLFGLGSTINLFNKIGQPFGGYMAAYAVGNNQWYFNASTPPWWSGVESAVNQNSVCSDGVPVGLSYGERSLFELNGQPYGPTAPQRFAAVYAAGQPCISVRTSQGSQTLERQVPVTLFTLGEFADLALPGLIAGFSHWLLAIVVFRAQPGAALNRVFAILNAVMACSFWQDNVLLSAQYSPETLPLTLSGAIIAAVAGVLMFHFGLLFPTPSSLYSRWLIRGLYVIALVIGVAYVASVVLLTFGGWSPLVGQLDSVAYTATVQIATGALLFTTVRQLWILLRHFSSLRVRRQMSILLLGTLLAAPALIASYHGSYGLNDQMHWYGLDLRYLQVAVPLSMAFIILRYKAFHGLSPLFMGIIVLTTSAVFASLGAWTLLQLKPTSVPERPLFVPMFALTGVISVFWSTQSSWQGVLGRALQHDRVGLRGVRQWGQQLVLHTGAPQLPDEITAALVTEFQLERAALWIWQEAETGFVLKGQHGQWLTPLPTRLMLDPYRATRRGGPVHVNADVIQPPDDLVPLYQLPLVEVIVPLIVSDRMVGLLALGKRADEDVFDERDLDIIELIAQQAALFVLTSQQIDELRQVPARVAKAQERERFKIAQELHDTIQQFLGYLPFYLEESRTMAYQDPGEADVLLRQCIEDVAQAARTVREIRGSLASLQLSDGLTKPLCDHIERFGARRKLNMAIDLAPDVDQYLPMESRQTIFRVIQQALDNAGEHAQATAMRVAVWREGGRVRFTVKDDGHGFSDEDYAQAEVSGSFGLKSMRDRVQSAGGELSIQSVVGVGTTIAGWIPTEAH